MSNETPKEADCTVCVWWSEESMACSNPAPRIFNRMDVPGYLTWHCHDHKEHAEEAMAAELVESKATVASTVVYQTGNSIRLVGAFAGAPDVAAGLEEWLAINGFRLKRIKSEAPDYQGNASVSATIAGRSGDFWASAEPEVAPAEALAGGASATIHTTKRATTFTFEPMPARVEILPHAFHQHGHAERELTAGDLVKIDGVKKAGTVQKIITGSGGRPLVRVTIDGKSFTWPAHAIRRCAQ